MAGVVKTPAPDTRFIAGFQKDATTKMLHVERLPLGVTDRFLWLVVAPNDLTRTQKDWALEVFKKSGYSAAEFNQLRCDAQAGRVLVSSDEDFDEFFRAEEARHLNNKDGLPQLPEEK